MTPEDPARRPLRGSRSAAFAGTHGERAISLVLAGLLALPAACGEAGAGSRRSTDAAAPAAPFDEVDLGDLIAALEPPGPEAHSGLHDDWLRRRRRTMKRMERADPAFGPTILDAFRERTDASIHVRTGLLEAAAVVNPEAARGVLVRLVREYGEDLGVRTEACRLLGSSSPEQAIEVIGPILMDPGRSSTAPPDEAMLEGWLEAHERTGRSPLPDLAYLATDPGRDEATRHMAIRHLAEHPSKVTTAALEEILTESTGNAYLRRLAAQSMVSAVEAGEACDILRRVLEHEVDISFREFLANVIADRCP